MKVLKTLVLIILLVCSAAANAQLGIKAGINTASEIKSFNQMEVSENFRSNKLQGYQIGLVYQLMPSKSGLGIGIGALMSQKGSTFIIDSTSVDNDFKQGYREINYMEVPLNLRYRLSLGFIGLYAFGGVYGGYALSAKTVNETDNTTTDDTFGSFIERTDYGYNVGAGVELFRKIQLGGTFSQGIKTTNQPNIILPLATSNTNKVITVNLVYMFLSD